MSAAAADATGVEGVYVGTRFVASDECRASLAAKRAITNVKSEELIQVGPDAKGWTRIMPPLQDPDELTPGHSGYCIGILEGDIVHGLVAASESAGGIHDIVPAAQIVKELGARFLST